MSRKFTVDLTAGDRFWTPEGLGSMNMDPNRAIGELVANSVDWRIQASDGAQSIIQIILSKNSLEVRDNGAGMNVEELKTAIMLAVASDNVRRPLRTRKGMFGMGMKVACLHLGWKITITTRSMYESDIENFLLINTKHYEDRHNIPGESRKPMLNGPLGDWKCGTSILIEDLTRKDLRIGTIKENISQVFSPELNVEGIKIEVVDIDHSKIYECKYIPRPLIDNSKIDLNDMSLFVTPDEHGENIQIRGWLGLLKSSGSGSGDWGLNLYKDNQLIERNHQTPSKTGGLMPKNPHPQLARTVGEIHLDMCQPAFHKVGFNSQTKSWGKVVELLEPYLERIMNASKDYRKKNPEKSHRVLKRIQVHGRVGKEESKKLADKTRPDKTDDKNNIIPEGPNVIKIDNNNYIFLLTAEPGDFEEHEMYKAWVWNYSSESKELTITMNKNSPVFSQCIDEQQTIVWRFVIAESIREFLEERCGYNKYDAKKFRDNYLTKLFQEEL